MSDDKSKLPDFKELTTMASKLFKGIKDSIDEIIHDYKEKRSPRKKSNARTEKSEEAKSSKTNKKKE